MAFRHPNVLTNFHLMKSVDESLTHLMILSLPCLPLLTQKAEDVPVKMSARCCQESSGSVSSSSGSVSSHSSGGSLQHAKEQLPKYQVRHVVSRRAVISVGTSVWRGGLVWCCLFETGSQVVEAGL